MLNIKKVQDQPVLFLCFYSSKKVDYEYHNYTAGYQMGR